MITKWWSKAPSAGVCGLQMNAGEINLAYARVEGDGLRLAACETHEVEDDWQAKTSLLSDRVRDLGVTSMPCNLVLEQSQYQLFMMDAPKVADEELREAIKWKVKELISFPLDQALIEVLRLPEDCGRAGQKLVYAVVAEKSVVMPAIEAIEKAKLQLQCIDIEDMANRNLAAKVASGPRAVAVIVLHQGRGSLSLVKNDCLYLSRNFSIDYQAGLLDDLPSDALVLELQRSFDYFERQLGQVQPSHIWLCGENVSADKITPAIQSAFAAEVGVLPLSEMLDPEEKFDSAILQRCFAAIGASLRVEADS